MHRPITGFHQDDEGHCVAGHRAVTRRPIVLGTSLAQSFGGTDLTAAIPIDRARSASAYAPYSRPSIGDFDIPPFPASPTRAAGRALPPAHAIRFEQSTSRMRRVEVQQFVDRADQLAGAVDTPSCA